LAKANSHFAYLPRAKAWGYWNNHGALARG